ncbi:MAG: 4-(cytidine 5'-diphospho)-2-C-methyl-D-erythritol kinase [Thermovirgaceae bacterium]
MSHIVLQTPTKLNLTLRVLDRRKDGFHNIVSTFLRLPVHETLTIAPVFDDSSGGDRLRVHGEKIRGRNILHEVLEKARDSGILIPPLVMELWKVFPPGTGTAAGSGNAAALVKWLEETWNTQFPTAELAKLGADVPFLRARDVLSIRGGVGEIALEKDLALRRAFAKLVMVPDFSSDTAGAYAAFDQEKSPAAIPVSEREAVTEAGNTIEALQRGEHVGLLPNDFTDLLLARYPLYERVFDLFEDCGAACWGITGSGSGCFAFFDERWQAGKAAWFSSGYSNIRKIFIME